MFAAKAVVGFIMPMLMSGALNALGGIGISGTMTVQTLLTSLISGLMVYLVPNKKA